jgi:YrbI family 3-deoxy-D-manno-octulosonate 8-phosphate phosphatase
VPRLSLIGRLRRVRLICSDVDGTLTDGRIVMSERGEFRTFSARDGMGVQLARAAGIDVVWISRRFRASRAVALRARELNVPLTQDTRPKQTIILDEARRRGLALDAVAFLGDDVQDLPAFAIVGLPVAVADAVREVRAAAAFTTRARGGEGALRELVERTLHAQGTWSAAVRELLHVELTADGKSVLAAVPNVRTPRDGTWNGSRPSRRSTRRTGTRGRK